jgi:single-stranded DNA-binding protein
VAADPLFATSSDGTPRVNLIVSEHLEDDQTVFHKVYSTKKEAARLKDLGVAKGNRVRVEGYVQNRERKNRDGTTTPETRVYAVHLKVYETSDTDASTSPAPSSDESY